MAFGAFAGLELIREGSGGDMTGAAIVAVLSFLVAYAAIAFFMRLTRMMSFTPFVIYRILLGVGLLVFAGAFMEG